MSIRVDFRDIKRFERDLGKIRKTAIPHAIRNTLNGAAFETMKNARGKVREKMILRNQWTERSIQVQKTKTLKVSAMRATVGSRQPYMRTQEEGGVKRSQGKQGAPVATSFASGEGEQAKPRKRLPRRPNSLRAIQLRSTRITGTRKQRNAARVKEAASSGRKHVYLDLGRRKGIFKITGGKRRPKPKMVWSLGKRAVRIPKNQWLEPSLPSDSDMIESYAVNLRAQLDRAALRTKR